MPTMEEITRAVDNNLHDSLTAVFGDDAFNLPQARMYGVRVDYRSGDVGVTFIDSDGDIYNLLERYNASDFPFTSYAFVTTGWAAPLNEDGEIEGRPSDHERRRRCRVLIVLQATQLASTIRFSDSEVAMYDEGEGTGSLRDAVEKFANA